MLARRSAARRAHCLVASLLALAILPPAIQAQETRVTRKSVASRTMETPGQPAASFSDPAVAFSAEGLSPEDIEQLEYALLLARGYSARPDGVWDSDEDKALARVTRTYRGLEPARLLDWTEMDPDGGLIQFSNPVTPTNAEMARMLDDLNVEWERNDWGDRYYEIFDKTISSPDGLMAAHDPDIDISSQVDHGTLFLMQMNLGDEDLETWHNWLEENRDALLGGGTRTVDGTRITSGVVESTGHYHYYMTRALPGEDGRSRLLSISAAPANIGRANFMVHGMRDGNTGLPGIPADSPLMDLLALAP
ncbi:hypothetical protein [Pseudooceanicola algae]|uniref:Uncharacterized protein n=1 Tax=Pseudooceanicola algae TaxID=1537215 RepID=A0A418SKY5_9RHOB|nr:hypothetical protein [Pseudooceanicola algae]QPM90995.1 hypothetical protein PSAL_022380 [Pseudooceanicola algae]